MKPVVIYSTHSRNNTEKIALAIAQAANCKSVKLVKDFDFSTVPLDDYDLIFLGTGIRGGEPYVELLNFLNGANFGNNKRFMLFMTWAGGGASNKLAYERVRRALEIKNQCLDENYFICLGQFGFTRRGRPNEADIAEAKKWAAEKIKVNTRN